MAPTFWSSLALMFQAFSRTSLRDGKAGEDSQAGDTPTADEAQQHKPTQEPGKAIENKTEDEKQLMKKMAIEIEEAFIKHDLSLRKDLPFRCADCDISFGTVEERSKHIKCSRLHYWCLRCGGIIELRDFSDLRSQDLLPHFRPFCSRCKQYFATVEDKKAHIRTSSNHCCCQICDDVVVEFNDASSLGLHYKGCHPLQYCHICNRIFAGADDLPTHMRANHTGCRICHKDLLTPESLSFHRRTCAYTNRSAQQEDVPLGYYATLGINSLSSHEEILKVAKEMRVKTHPDRMRRQGGLTAEQEKKIDAKAALVGQAADILSDPISRAKYDKELRMKIRTEV